MGPWSRLWRKFTLLARATPTVETNLEVEQLASTFFTLCQMKGTEEAPDVGAPMYFLVAEMLAQLTETLAYSKLGKPPAESEFWELFFLLLLLFLFICKEKV